MLNAESFTGWLPRPGFTNTPGARWVRKRREQARNRWRWWKRRRRDRTVSLDAPAGSESETPLSAGIRDEGAGDPERQAIARERERALLSALRTLSRSYREVIVLRDIEGLSYEEVAHALELNVGTVKSRLSRGRSELRRRLEGSL